MNFLKVLLFVAISIIVLDKIGVDGSPWNAVPTLSCKLKSKKMIIKEDDCRSNRTVVLTYCEGRCRSASIPTFKYPYFKTKCKCCRATLVTSKVIKLDCPASTVTSNQSRKSIAGKVKEIEEPPYEKYAVRDVALSCKCETCVTS